MAPRNPLREDDHPQEAIRGEQITHASSHKVARLIGPGGIVREMPLSGTYSRPDSNGGYLDVEEVNIVTDHAGNPLPEHGRPEAVSHSGLFITAPEKVGCCTCFLHPPNRSRNFYDGQDGRVVNNGHGTCSYCQWWTLTIYAVSGIVLIALVVGLFKGTGFF
ncbi:MAG: hypothetical protein SWQ30_16355 [Thermodesulfobacteriota bacterium]|nr:hypothetical protein [Thermodesulfobacteriota bacterium]